MQRTLILIFAAGAALAACSSGEGERAAARDAAPAGPAAAATPRYADQDGDGKVTRAEAAVDPALARNFTRYDTDSSGALERAEFARIEAGAKAQREERGRAETASQQPYSKPK